MTTFNDDCEPALAVPASADRRDARSIARSIVTKHVKSFQPLITHGDMIDEIEAALLTERALRIEWRSRDGQVTTKALTNGNWAPSKFGRGEADTRKQGEGDGFPEYRTGFLIGLVGALAIVVAGSMVGMIIGLVI